MPQPDAYGRALRWGDRVAVPGRALIMLVVDVDEINGQEVEVAWISNGAQQECWLRRGGLVRIKGGFQRGL